MSNRDRIEDGVVKPKHAKTACPSLLREGMFTPASTEGRATKVNTEFFAYDQDSESEGTLYVIWTRKQRTREPAVASTA